MISRRLLRIKVLQVLYAYFRTDKPSLKNAEKELTHSIQKTYELYHLLLLLVLDVTLYAESRIELNLQKKRPTEDDLSPNLKFINNKIVNQIRNNKQFSKFLEEKPVSWVLYPELVRNLYNELCECDFYKSYMSITEQTYEEDKQLIIKFLSDLVQVYEPLYGSLEEQSIYWNDEIEFVISMIIKTIKGFKEEDIDQAELLELFKNDEDRDFATELLRKATLHHEEYLKVIDKFTDNWELDRIAFMDVLIMTLAITELTDFPSIPVKVTLNEYIDIAKFYSTQKSGVFINGILDKIIHSYKTENKITKQGRGLIGEV